MLWSPMLRKGRLSAARRSQDASLLAGQVHSFDPDRPADHRRNPLRLDLVGRVGCCLADLSSKARGDALEGVRRWPFEGPIRVFAFAR